MITVHGHRVSGKRDDALDDVLRSIGDAILKHDDITALRKGQKGVACGACEGSVGQLVRDETIAGFQCR